MELNLTNMVSIPLAVVIVRDFSYKNEQMPTRFLLQLKCWLKVLVGRFFCMLGYLTIDSLGDPFQF